MESLTSRWENNTITKVNGTELPDEEIDRNYSFTELCVIMVMLTTFSVVGVTGNALVLYVYSQKRDRQVANHFIIVLAIVDFITCSVVIPFTIYYEYVNKTISSDLLCKLYHFLITSMIPFSVLIMVAIAVDRYFCICHPFLQALTLTRAKIVTVTMAIFSAVLGVVVACMNGVYVYIPRSKYIELWYGDSYVSQDAYGNITASNENNDLVKVNIEYCSTNGIIFDELFVMIYHRFYTTLYLVCLIVIIVLYALIYKLVRTRRAKRLQQQSSRLLPVNPDSTFSGSPMTDEVTLNGEGSKSWNGKTDQDSKSPGNSIKSHQSPPHSDANKSPTMTKKSCQWPNDNSLDSRRERMRIANLKTAAMLFVVTVVFVITYMPAFVMTMIGKLNIIALYLYFANNVANPVIYSFMNKNFREDLVKIFKR